MSAFDWPAVAAMVVGTAIGTGLAIAIDWMRTRCPTGYMWLHRQVAEMERAEQVARKGKRK